MDLDVAVAHINLHGIFVHEIGICCPVLFHFYDRYVFAESVQVNGAFGTDKSSAEDDNLLSKGRFRLMKSGKPHNFFIVNSRNRRNNGFGTDGSDDNVSIFCGCLLCGQLCVQADIHT